jgi:Glycosyl hydrolase family 26
MRIARGIFVPLLVSQLIACGSTADDSNTGGSGGVGGTAVAMGGAPANVGGASATSGAGGALAGAGNEQGGSAGSSAGAPAFAGASGAGVGGSAGASAGATGGGGASGGGVAGHGGASVGGAGGTSSGGAGHGGTGGGGAGSVGGAGGNGGTAGAGGSTDCGVLPVTPNATDATKKVLCYLRSMYGNHILSSQEEDNSDDGMNTIVAASGKYPAIRAFDVNNSMAPTQCAQHWQQRGGLCMFGYHMGINGGTYSDKVDLTKVLTAGTAENTSFNADLDRYAQYIQPVKAAGGVALVRLFHEAGKGCAWFWWSMGTSDQYKAIYKYAFNYLTATKGLNNLLWIVPMCGTPDPSFDPGKQYSDFGGADTYVTNNGPLTSIFNATVSSFPDRPAVLHECGTIPDPAQLKSTNTKWLLFNLWSNPFFHPDHNSAAWIKTVYTSDYVITADELPSFK